MCLDPRFKDLDTNMTGVQENEKQRIWEKILELMVIEKSPTAADANDDNDNPNTVDDLGNNVDNLENANVPNVLDNDDAASVDSFLQQGDMNVDVAAENAA